MSSIWSLEGVKWHTSLQTPCLCCRDWFNRQRQLTESVRPTAYSPHTACDTAPNSTPYTWARQTLQSSPCTPFPQFKSDFSRECTALLDYTHSSHSGVQSSAKPHKGQQHGEQHVMCPPAQPEILQQEFHPQKQVRTIQPVQVFILVSVSKQNTSHAIDCYFRLSLSAGRNSWYFSGFESWG